MTNDAVAVASVPAPSLDATAARVATLLASFEVVATPREARERADDLARTLATLYGRGLERVLEIVYATAGDARDDVFARLVADPFVESLLCLHGLHPIAIEDRVRAALDSVRPYLESHAGGVEIAGIEDDVVLLRLEGSCDGCPSSAATVKLAVERAILERVPEIRAVRAVGVPETSADGASRAGTLGIVGDWLDLADLAGLAAAPSMGVATRLLHGTDVLFVRFDDDVYAYRDACPVCGHALSGGRIERPRIACAHCDASYDVAHGGRRAA
ncbi:MAG: hypothetical protein NVS2B8_10960 [Vulcanimicrobiaceae bacterium]